MPINIEHDGVGGEAEATALLAAKGLHTTLLDVEPVHNSAHWHHFDAEFYILQGTLEFTDVATNTTHACKAGSKISVPAKAIHAERSEDGYRIVLGTSVPAEEFGDPVNRPIESL